MAIGIYMFRNIAFAHPADFGNEQACRNYLMCKTICIFSPAEFYIILTPSTSVSSRDISGIMAVGSARAIRHVLSNS